MATVDASTSALLKTRAAEGMEKNIFSGHPVLALATKKTGLGGKAWQSALQIGGCVARGHRFADVIALSAASKRVEMDWVFQESYAASTAGGVDAALASGGQNSIEELLGVEQDITTECMGLQLEQQAVSGDSYGTIGVVTSVVSGTTGTVVLQIQDATSLNSVFVDDVLAFKSDPATASLQTGTMKVTVVDQAHAQITGTMQASGDATSYAGYSFGLASVYANSTARQTMHGFKSMFTRTGLTNAFEGLASRASDPIRLAGHYFSVGTMGVKDSISLLISSISNFASAKPEFAIVSPNSLLELETDLGARIRYTETDAAGVNFGSLTYNGPKGKVTVMSSSHLPDTDIVVIDPSSLIFGVNGDDIATPVEEGENGSGWRQLEGSDAKRYAIRAVTFFACNAFWKNGRAVRTV